jgi:hypothetical protein
MLQLFKVGVFAFTILFVNQVLSGENSVENKLPVLEILKWKSKKNVSDENMIESVANMVKDLNSLKGFLNQALYKSSSGEWIDIYYWETEEDAYASSTIMADKKSYTNLINLIEPESVTIEVIHQLQSSGGFSFK